MTGLDLFCAVGSRSDGRAAAGCRSTAVPPCSRRCIAGVAPIQRYKAPKIAAFAPEARAWRGEANWGVLGAQSRAEEGRRREVAAADHWRARRGASGYGNGSSQSGKERRAHNESYCGFGTAGEAPARRIDGGGASSGRRRRKHVRAQGLGEKAKGG